MNAMKLRYGDYMIFAAVALLAIASVLLGVGPRLDTGGVTAEIWMDNRLVRSVDLDMVTKPVRIELGEACRIVVLVERGRVRFESSDCPDKVCVHTGWLTRAGQMAACVPGQALIKIVGNAGQDVVVR